MNCQLCNKESISLCTDFDSDLMVCDNCYPSVSNKPCINKLHKDNWIKRENCYNKQLNHCGNNIDPFCHDCIKGTSLDRFFK